MAIAKQIRELVRKIPKGKVTTYGEVARVAGTRDNRLVGGCVIGWFLKTGHWHRVMSSEVLKNKREG